MLTKKEYEEVKGKLKNICRDWERLDVPLIRVISEVGKMLEYYVVDMQDQEKKEEYDSIKPSAWLKDTGKYVIRNGVLCDADALVNMFNENRTKAKEEKKTNIFDELEQRHKHTVDYFANLAYEYQKEGKVSVENVIKFCSDNVGKTQGETNGDALRNLFGKITEDYESVTKETIEHDIRKAEQEKPIKVKCDCYKSGGISITHDNKVEYIPDVTEVPLSERMRNIENRMDNIERSVYGEVHNVVKCECTNADLGDVIKAAERAKRIK